MTREHQSAEIANLEPRRLGLQLRCHADRCLVRHRRPTWPPRVAPGNERASCSLFESSSGRRAGLFSGMASWRSGTVQCHPPPAQTNAHTLRYSPLRIAERSSRAKNLRRASSCRASQGAGPLQRRHACRRHDHRGRCDAAICPAMPRPPARVAPPPAARGHLDIDEGECRGGAEPAAAESAAHSGAARRDESLPPGARVRDVPTRRQRECGSHRRALHTDTAVDPKRASRCRSGRPCGRRAGAAVLPWPCP